MEAAGEERETEVSEEEARSNECSEGQEETGEAAQQPPQCLQSATQESPSQASSPEQGQSQRGQDYVAPVIPPSRIDANATVPPGVDEAAALESVARPRGDEDTVHLKATASEEACARDESLYRSSQAAADAAGGAGPADADPTAPAAPPCPEKRPVDGHEPDTSRGQSQPESCSPAVADVRPPGLRIPPRRRPSTAGARRSLLSVRGPDTSDSIMLQARKARQRAEQEVKLLINRLKHLQMQEEQMRKRTQVIETRAKEVAVLKTKHQESKVQHAVQEQVFVQNLQGIKHELHEVTESRKQKLKGLRAHINEARKLSAAQVRNMRQELAVNLEAGRRAELETRRQKSARVRHEEIVRKRQKEELWVKKSEKSAEEYARRIAHEARQAAVAEQTIRRLEEEEQALIERVKRAQDQQHHAYKQLHQSLVTTPTMVMAETRVLMQSSSSVAPLGSKCRVRPSSARLTRRTSASKAAL